MILNDGQDLMNPVCIAPNCMILRDGQVLVVGPRVVWFNTG